MNIIKLIINFFKKICFFIKTCECDDELSPLTENMDTSNSTDADIIQIDFDQIYKERL